MKKQTALKCDWEIGVYPYATCIIIPIALFNNDRYVPTSCLSDKLERQSQRHR
jgi:hypothetical protein